MATAAAPAPAAEGPGEEEAETPAEEEAEIAEAIEAPPAVSAAAEGEQQEQSSLPGAGRLEEDRQQAEEVVEAEVDVEEQAGATAAPFIATDADGYDDDTFEPPDTTAATGAK